MPAIKFKYRQKIEKNGLRKSFMIDSTNKKRLASCTIMIAIVPDFPRVSKLYSWINTPYLARNC